MLTNSFKRYKYQKAPSSINDGYKRTDFNKNTVGLRFAKTATSETALIFFGIHSFGQILKGISKYHLS